MALTVGIMNDAQIPYVCPRAWSVALQIFRDAKLDLLIYNGDFGDYRTLTTRYPLRYGSGIIAEMREEIERQRTLLAEAQKTIRPKKQKSLIAQLRSELRLRQRVMRLKHEQKLEGITQQIDRQLAAERAGEAYAQQQAKFNEEFAAAIATEADAKAQQEE